MSLRDSFKAGEEQHHQLIKHNTWGHLFPEGGYFEGKIRIATSVYGHTLILDEEIPGIPILRRNYVNFYRRICDDRNNKL